MEVKVVPIEKVKEGERFRHEMGDLEELAESILEKGIVQPLTVDTKMNLVAGGRRLAAAKEAGLKEVPVIIRNVEGELDLREIELLENVMRRDLHWTERAALEKRIFELKKEQDPEWSQRKQSKALDQSVGSTNRRIALANLIDDIPELADQPNEQAAWKKWKKIEENIAVAAMRDKASSATKDAVKYAKDHYKIGDALEGMEKVNDGIVHFAEVDPPYAIELQKRKGRNTDMSMMDRYNEISGKDYPSFVGKAAEETFRILADNSFCVWWFGMEWYSTVLATLREVGFRVNGIPGMWYKGPVGQTASPDTMLASSYEPFFVCRKGQPKLVKRGRSNVFHYSPVSPARKYHPAERPLDLMLEILDTFVYPGSRILVPFLGSGVTLRAAYKRDLVGFGWDMDELAKKHFINRVTEDTTQEDEEGEEE